MLRTRSGTRFGNPRSHECSALGPKEKSCQILNELCYVFVFGPPCLSPYTRRPRRPSSRWKQDDRRRDTRGYPLRRVRPVAQVCLEPFQEDDVTGKARSALNTALLI